MTSTERGSQPAQPANPLPVYWMLIANLISNVGNSITMLAIPWFVLQTTGSAGQMGLVAAATVGPMVISSFVGGTLTDRMSHRQLAVFSDVLSGLTVAAIPVLHVTGALNLATLIALVFLGAIFDGPGMNARQAMVPKLAERGGMSLERVNSGFGIARSLMSLLGAPIAGVLIAIFGATGALWVTAATFGLSATIVRFMLPATSRPEPTGATMAADMKDGLRYLFRSRLLRSIVLTATALNMVFNPLFSIGIPVYIQSRGHDADTLGVLLASEAAGVLLGSVIYGWIGERLPARLTVIASLLLLTAPLFGVALEPGLPVMWALLFLVGLGSGVVNPLLGTFIQRYTPEQMLGRAFGTFISVAMLASPVGMLVGGALIGSQGFGVAALAGAIVVAIFAAGLAFNGSLSELGGPGEAPAEPGPPRDEDVTGGVPTRTMGPSS
jgi:MFS family permease